MRSVAAVGVEVLGDALAVPVVVQVRGIGFGQDGVA